MRRRLAAALALAAAGLGAPPAAAPAEAAVRLSAPGSDARLQALTVAGGYAYAVVDSGEPGAPFALVRSSGVGRSDLGSFGVRGAEFPDVAAAEDGRIQASWLRPVSGGSVVEVAGAPAGANGTFGDPRTLAIATGPARLGLTLDATLAAFPDRDGNVALHTEPSDSEHAGEATPAARTETLTSSAPERRHLPLALALGDGPTPLILDLVQRRERTELRVVGGEDAPSAAVVTVAGPRAVPAAFAREENELAVAYMSQGRAVLATPGAGGTWRRRRLPGPGGGGGSPAVAMTDGRTFVAYSQAVRTLGRKRTQREIYVAELEGGAVTLTRLTDTPAHDGSPLAAAGAAGEAYVAWSRRKGGELIPMLERVD